MSKLLVVIGATGNQGGSVVSYVSKELSDMYKIRAITRDSTTQRAQELKDMGIEVAEGDVTDRNSLVKALNGADVVFSMTSTGDELETGKSIADVSAEVGAKFIIWSSLPSVSKITEGELQVPNFEMKAGVEEYIRGLPIKSAIFAPGNFLQNFQTLLKPKKVEDGYSIYNIMDPKSTFPCIDVVADTGKFVGTILASPDKFNGKTILGALGLYTLEEIAQSISKSTGKTVTYNQIPVDVFSSFFPPSFAKIAIDMFLFLDKFEIYGPETKSIMENTKKSINFVPTSIDEYFESNIIPLD